MGKKTLALFVCGALLLGMAVPAFASDEFAPPEEPAMAVITDDIIASETIAANDINPAKDLPASSAVLMDVTTGTILVAFNERQRIAPASITKIMSLLLFAEALDSGKISLEDVVTCSTYAASMGGSQIWLEPNETMTVDQLLRAVAVGSANDATVALAEHIAGSESAFVQAMNKRAAELGMSDTNFVNACGLDADGHLTSARDVALMSRALLGHPIIIQYTTIWMDSLRDGATQLVNTNRLVRTYPGITGLKTGTTDKAGSCLAASAMRDNLHLVAVVLGSPTSDQRFAATRALLDYGFANYEMALPPAVAPEELKPVKVLRGMDPVVTPVPDTPAGFLVEKGKGASMVQTVQLNPSVTAPVEKGQVVGKVVLSIDGSVVGEYPLRAEKAVDKMTLGGALYKLWSAALRMKY